MAEEMAAHGVKKFKARIELSGDNFAQTIDFEGHNCHKNADLTSYIAGLMKPRLDNLVPGEMVELREQLVKANSARAAAQGEVEELKKQLATIEKRLDAVTSAKRSKSSDD